MDVAVTVIDTPLGRYALAAGEAGICHVGPDGSSKRAAGAGGGGPAARRHLERATDALREYFAGRRTHFDDLTFSTTGRPFERRVWRALREIPFGATESYGAIARRLAAPGAARAVGAANRANPLAILVPCHRVIGADGSLTGYAGGTWRKRWLLDHEASARSRPASQPAGPAA